MTTEPLPVTLRPLAADEHELNFVRKSWLRTARKSWLGKAVSKPEHYELHARLVARILTRDPLTTTLVAEVTPGELAGFACFGRDVLHYVYTKDTYRRMSVARRLMATDATRRASYWTWAARDCPLFRDYVFNPYLAFEETA